MSAVAEMPKTAKKTHKFRVISGLHTINSIVRAKVLDKDGKEVDSIKDSRTGKNIVGEVVGEEERTYGRGDIIETTVDLSQTYDKPGNPPQFERITPGAEFSALSGQNWTERRKDETMESFRARMTDIQGQAQRAASLGGDEEQTLNSMGYEDLVKMCAEEEIDRSRVKPNDKQGLIKTILAHSKGLKGK